jgi:hypothetical protein
MQYFQCFILDASTMYEYGYLLLPYLITLYGVFVQSIPHYGIENFVLTSASSSLS